jgi:hypothetical protein
LVLPFCFNKNYFGKFPELGYSQDVGGIRSTDGSKYDAAISGAWLQDNKFIIDVQIIDRYFGNMSMIFAFRDGECAFKMTKTAEDFLDTYQGIGTAKKV